MTSSLSHVHYKGNEDFIARIEDYVNQAYANYKVFTPFLSVLEQQLITTYIGKQMYVRFFGGSENNEYCRCCISYEPVNDRFPIVCLRATYNTKFDVISHRDVLGALMHLKIKRNQFGDIIIQDNEIYVYVNEEIAHFIKQELTKIKRCVLQFEISDEVVDYKVMLAYETKMISSLRLDVIVSAITNKSREVAKKMVLASLVKVNHQVVEECSYLCNNECVISIQKYGRFVLQDTGRKTKSGRYVVEVGKYL